MKFSYRHFRNKANPTESIAKPMVGIRLTHGSKGINLLALIDSGADVCLFHSSFAEALGIDYKPFPSREIGGIGGNRITAFFHPVHLTVIGLGSIDVSVGFTESDGVSALLGQAGFFDEFCVTFRRYRDSMDIKTRGEDEKRG